MEINVEKLKGNLRELNILIEDYEKNYYNLYNELSNCSIFWEDNNATLFFDNVDVEKKGVKETIDEFKNVSELYDYLVNRYENFGNKIKYDLKLKSEILNKIDNYLDDINDILSDLRRLDFRFCSSITNDIYSDINKMNDISDILVSLRKNIKKRFDEFEEIEKEVNLKVSKIKIDILKENDISRFV